MNRNKKYGIAAALCGIALWTGWQPPQIHAESAEERLEQLDQKIRVLERKLEISDEASSEKAKTSAKADFGKDGLAIKSADGDFQIRFRGLVQTDGRFYLDDQRTPITNGFLIRRARPILDATLYRDFDAYLVPDFGGGAAALQDAYLDFHPAPQFKFRAGKFKEPFGLERLQSDSNNKFVELALPSALVPNRDVGAQVYGDLLNGTVNYAFGVFNGVVDAGSADADTNDSKDVAARIVLQPFKNAYSNWVKDLSVGFAATDGTQTGATALTTYKSFGQQTFFSYLSTAAADGERLRLSPQLSYYNGPFGLISEYVVASQEVRRGAAVTKVSHQAWQVAGSYLLTGEQSTYNKAVAPLKPFDWKTGQPGAFEIAARYGEFDIDDDVYALGLAQLTPSATKAAEWAVALNWYLNKAVKVAVNYGQTDFTNGAARSQDREQEKVFLTRFQLAF
jgi:phosphate-selective porin OprO/OprP